MTTLRISGSANVSVKYFDAEGKPVEVHEPAAPPERALPPREPASPSVRYEFAGWAGPEDVPTLCGQYLRELGEIVADGRAQGLLSS